MTKREDGGEERQPAAMGELKRPEHPSARFPRSPGRALLFSSALTAFCFLLHIFFLLLVDPLHVFNFTKETAYLYASIPLCFGVVFLVLSVYNFIVLEERTATHILLLLAALSFGSLNLQGLLGLGMHYLKLGGHA